MEAVLNVRPYKPSDLNFIQNSWGSSYYKGAEFLDYSTPKEFNDLHRPKREQILDDPTTAVLVCCGKEDEDLILGYIILQKSPEGLLIHYIYVKQAFKGEGISEELLKQIKGPVLVTHMTDKAMKIISKKQSRFKDFKFSKEPIMVRQKFLNTFQKE